MLDGRESVGMERILSNEATSPLFSSLGPFVFYCSLLVVTVPTVHAQQEIENVLPDSSVLLWQVKPTEVFASKSLNLFPREALGAVSSDELGVDLQRMPRISGAYELGPNLVSAFSICFMATRSTDIANLDGQKFGPIRISEANQNVRLRNWRGTDIGVVQMDGRWLAGSQSSLKKMLQANGQPHRLSELLRRKDVPIVLIVDVKRLKNRLTDYLKFFEISPLTEKAVLLTRLCDLVDHIVVRIELAEQAALEVSWTVAEGRDVGQVSALIDRILKLGVESMGAYGMEMFRWSAVDAESPEVWGAYWRRMLGSLSDSIKRNAEDNRVVTRLENLEELMFVVSLAGMSANLLEGVQESLPRSKTESNLEEIAIAIQGFESVHRRIPQRAIRDNDGKPLLSWRVLLLPYLGQDELYSQFRLNEAWDSEHNKKLLEKMPAVYANPNTELQLGYTTYLAPFGYVDQREQTAWDVEPLLLRQVSAGLGNTAAVVEVTPLSAVPWTKPEDFDLKERELLEFLGEPPTGGLVVMLDGNSYDLSRWKDKRRLKAVLTVNGGEAVTAPF